MPKNELEGDELPQNHPAHHHTEEIVKLILKGLIPIVLLSGGLILLALRISGWSLIFGLPLTIFGSVFLIYTYDEMVRKKVDPDGYDEEEEDLDKKE
jgi:hypothetical protein